ncbi:MAG: penicillin-binding protein activator [Candidatus Caldarchaeum sp.]
MKGNKALWLTIGVIVVAIIAIVAVQQTRQPKEEKVIKIGAILPLTGDISEYGQRVKRGIDIAVEEINKSPGGLRVQVKYEDSEGVPQKGVNAAQKLINTEGVRYIIGAVSSSVTLSIVPITTRAKVLLMSPASSSPKLSGISPFFVRNWPSDVLEATVLAEYAFDKLSVRRVIILYTNNDYGLGLQQEFVKSFKRRGGSIVAVEGYPLNARDFKGIIAKYGQSFKDVDAIYLAGYHRDMAIATKQLREAGYSRLILGDADYGIPELIQIAGRAAEGAIYATPWYDPESNETSKRFVEVFKQRYATVPSEFEANGYDAVRLIVSGIQQRGDDPAAVAQFIRELKEYPGAGGRLTFTQAGDVIKPIAIMRVENGTFQRIEVFEHEE